jgi:integrase
VDHLVSAIANLCEHLAHLTDLLACIRKDAHISGMQPGRDGTAAGTEARQDRAGTSIDEAVAQWRDEMTGRGCRGSSITRFVQLVKRAADSQGWHSVQQLDYLSAVAFLAHHRRGDHGGKPWGARTYNQAVTVLRTFGEFCRRSGWVKDNPMADLQTWKAPMSDGCRALTADEARRVLVAAIRRQGDARAHGFAALFWHTLFCTGLRYAELCSLRWGMVRLDGAHPGIRLVREMHGNKAGRADYIPLVPESVHLLKRWRDLVPHAAGQAVFPVVPTRQTWRMDRDDAKIAMVDHRGRKTSIHCARKTYCTLIDKPGLSSGLVAKLARHATTLTEARYIDHEEADLWEAVQDFPLLWPDEGGDWSKILRKKSPDSSSGLANTDISGYVGGASPDDADFTDDNPADSSDGLPPGLHRGSHLEAHGRSSLGSALLEPRTRQVEAASALSPVTPTTELKAQAELTDEVALVLSRWLATRLDRAPHRRPGDGRSNPHPPT